MAVAAPNPGARIAWELRRALRRAGLPAVIGTAALMLAAPTAWQAHLLAGEREALAARLAATRSVRPAAPPPDAASRLSGFYQWLPAHDTIPAQLATLVEIAGKSGVTLAKADYKPQQDDSAQFMRYQITLPIKAEYAKVQAFILAALQGMPSLTLEAVTFKREQIEAGEVEARVQFNLLVRKRSGA